MTDERLIQVMEQGWSALDEVCTLLAPEEWGLPTDLPAWSVKDNVSHISGVESLILGRPRAEGEVSGDHIRNDLGVLNEREVAKRRPWPPAEVIAEFRELTLARREQLRALTEEQWTTPMETPLGTLTWRDFLPIRILDVFCHEQDVRRAIGRPGHLDGECAALVFGRFSLALPRILGKNAGAPEGASIVLEVSHPGRTLAAAVTGGRGAAVDPPADPTARATMDFETYLCLSGGRWSAERALSDGRVKVEGDQDLARRVLENMAVTP